MNEVIQVNGEQKEKLFYYLNKYIASSQNNGSMVWKTDEVSITLYNSGKLLFQGKAATAWYMKVAQELGLNNIANFSRETEIENDSNLNIIQYSGLPRIGIDESGKGDFFGPLVTVAFYIESKYQEYKIQELGVKDSKRITDKKISQIAKELKLLGRYEIIKINPSKYNQLWGSMGNVNKILAWSHAKSLENLLNKSETQLAISDQFGDESLILSVLQEKGKSINLVQMHKAEADLAVAAASIIARDTFVSQLKILEEKFGVRLPKGASSSVVTQGKMYVDKYGKEKLSEIAKTHFKTYDKVISG